MSVFDDMTAPDIASLVERAGMALVAKNPATAAQAFSELSGAADAALGERIVRRRLFIAHDRQREIDGLVKRIAFRHAITVEAIKSDRLEDHIVQAKRHLAHALHYRLGLTPRIIGRVMGCDRVTAWRRIGEWKKYLNSEGVAMSEDQASNRGDRT